MRREEREGREEGGGGEKCIHLITDTNVSNATDSVPFFYCVMTLNISLPPSRRAVDPRSRACSLAAPLIESAGQQRRRRRVGAE